MKKRIEKNQYTELFKYIEELQEKEKQIVIAIDGNCTSGKTTLAELLKQKYNANVFHMDDFFRSKKQGQSKEVYANNIDFERLVNQVVKPLETISDIRYQSFNCKDQQLSEYIQAKQNKINIVEGAYSFHPNVMKNYDIKIFMKSSIFQQIRRIIKRNGFKELKNYLKIWIPKENSYFKFYQIENTADFVFKSKH